MKIRKKEIIILAAFLTLSFSLRAQDVKTSTKKTAAVMDFNVISGMDKNEALALTNKFRASFANTKSYVVLERSDMDRILKEQDFKLSDACNSENCAVEVGQLLAAEKIVTGDIGKIGKTYSINIKLVDISKGTVDKTVNREYKGELDGLLQVFDEMAQEIAGVKKKSHALWYVLGGAAVLGGGAAVLLGGGKKTPGPSTLSGNPPGTP
jgi:TolB-like protein